MDLALTRVCSGKGGSGEGGEFLSGFGLRKRAHFKWVKEQWACLRQVSFLQADIKQLLRGDDLIS